MSCVNLASKASETGWRSLYTFNLGARTQFYTAEWTNSLASEGARAHTGILRKMRAIDKWADWLFIGTENVAADRAAGCCRAASPNSFSRFICREVIVLCCSCLQKRKKQSKMNESNGRQQLCLKWNNHYHAIQYNFETLLQTEDFADVTLATEGQHIRAHKIVLSSCSPLFQVCHQNSFFIKL